MAVDMQNAPHDIFFISQGLKNNTTTESHAFPENKSRIIDCIHRWSTGLQAVLDDPDGVEMFNNFIASSHASGYLLDFWFACKGFRTNSNLNNADKLFQVAKVIYRTYIKSGAVYTVPLPTDVKHHIVERMAGYHRGYKTTKHNDVSGIDRQLFDEAQESIMILLENNHYQEFLRNIQIPNGFEKLRALEISIFQEQHVYESFYPALLGDKYRLADGSSLNCTSQYRSSQQSRDV